MAGVETIDIDRWAGPFSENECDRALAALERGDVLFFPDLTVALNEQTRLLLSPAFGDGKAKNVSFDATTGALRGTAATGTERYHLAAMMTAFADATRRFVCDLLPSYVAVLERGRTSYRPVEIAGRTYSPLNDDTRLHVDAFPSTPTQGRRILRFFANVNPSGTPRLWHIGEDFTDFAGRFVPALRRPRATAAWLLALLSITRGRRTAYDQLMLDLHNSAKRDLVYQQTAPHSEFAFPAGSSWLCFTDQVLHAALAGQYALEQTFYLDVTAMAQPARSPLRQLERLTGRTLA
jgi:hypothetical protein